MMPHLKRQEENSEMLLVAYEHLTHKFSKDMEKYMKIIVTNHFHLKNKGTIF